MRLNALGYQDIQPLPDTRANSARAADLLGKSVTRNASHREERELEALQGIGFALLAIAERQCPQQAPRKPGLLRRLQRARNSKTGSTT